MHAYIVIKMILLALLLSGCENGTPRRNPFDPGPDATKPAPKVSAVPRPEGPPELRVDGQGPKVGWLALSIDQREGRERFAREMETNRRYFEGQDVIVLVERAARIAHVVAMLDELHRLQASRISLVTETRPEYPSKLEFVPVQRVRDLPGCTVVMMIMKDRATAVWKISGGTASRRAKGLAGPDLSTTGETIKRYAKACQQSSTMLVSGAEDVEWGLVYDLAASAQRIEGVSFSKIVLLRQPPIAGRPVRLDQEARGE